MTVLRKVLFLAVLASLLNSCAATLTVPATVVPNEVTGPTSPTDANAALQILQAGNVRYVQGNSTCFNRLTDRPTDLNNGQSPIAMILGCADSRVLPELAFDQDWGKLFTCRVAGNVADTFNLGSCEYAVDHLETKLIVVLGHENCGAVSAALQQKQLGGNLQPLIDQIGINIQPSLGLPGDALNNAIEANVRANVTALANDAVISQAVSDEGVKILGAVYHFENGQVVWLQ